MNEMISYQDVQDKILEVRGERVLLDRDVAELYGVETKDINRAVKNNPDKFSAGYTHTLDSDELCQLVKNFHRFEKLKHSSSLPTAFSERGLYMLATILKSPVATQTTIIHLASMHPAFPQVYRCAARKGGYRSRRSRLSVLRPGYESVPVIYPSPNH